MGKHLEQALAFCVCPVANLRYGIEWAIIQHFEWLPILFEKAKKNSLAA